MIHAETLTCRRDFAQIATLDMHLISFTNALKKKPNQIQILIAQSGGIQFVQNAQKEASLISLVFAHYWILTVSNTKV